MSEAAAAAPAVSLTPLIIIVGYMFVLLGLGIASTRFFRGTSKDYFVASRSVGPFLLLMSVFGTTMTGFALVGSTAKSYQLGIGVYGLMASWSGLVHSAIFFLIGIKLWAMGKRYGYMTQIQFFRDRFQSNALGYLLFPILVGLVIPYLLVGIISAARVIRPITTGMFPGIFAGVPHPNPKLAEMGKTLFDGSVPPWLTGLVVCGVVLFYVFFGGVRSAIWANTFQTIVFMIMGIVAFFMISKALGGPAAATAQVLEFAPKHVAREGLIHHPMFLSYIFVPLSVGMFPHLFQHWLTAKSAKTFRLTVIAHPIFIAIVWVPCILVGIWAAAQGAQGLVRIPNPNAALGAMLGTLVKSPILSGMLTAGILAAIMSSLDSQFVCLGTMFTNDIVVNKCGKDRFTDKQLITLARVFVVAIVALAYFLSMLLLDSNVFDLGVWCFTGFASLFPLVFAAVYWRRATAGGAFACVITTAVVWFYFFYQDIFLNKAGDGEFLVGGMVPAATIFAVSAIALIVGSLVTKPMDDAHVDRFFIPAPKEDKPAAS
jgi:SSS family solute:Na+ symporter